MISSGESESENVLEENYIDFGIKDISDLSLKPNITTLNLHYNSIVNIKGLNNLMNLRHLDLSSNLITKINGLDSLIFLRTLNLSSNRIKKLEGISNLRQLIKLNISYNEIVDISGLNEFINICDHPLTVIELQGNQIRLVTHLIKSCQNLVNLRQLCLCDSNSTNPLCKTPDFRKKIFFSLQNLRILDGKDREGRPIKIDILSDIPGLEQFLEYLSSSTDHYSEVQSVETPKILTKYKKVKDSKEIQKSCLTDREPDKDDKDCQSELKSRIQELENKMISLLNKNSEEVTEIGKTTKYDEERYCKNRSNDPKDSRNMMIKGKNENSDSRIANLLKDLDLERKKRVDVENKLQILVNKYKEIQLMMINDKKNKTHALKSTEMLVEAFSKEKSCRQELAQKVSDLQNCINEKENCLTELKVKLESCNIDYKRKMELKENLITNKSEEIEKITKDLEEYKLAQKMAESNLVSIKKHCFNLESQVEDMQSIMSKREKEYQTSLINRYPLDSQELKDYVGKQVNAAKTESSHEINAWKTKVTESNDQYKELENEFRLALHMEADRYKQLENAYLQIVSESNSMKTKLEILNKKDEESKSLIAELTTVAKEQKTKLIDLSKNKQETNRNNKERILTLEAHLEEARKQMLQFELTRQENKKIQGKLSAQESLIEGLRTERKLWSEELAQQGYLLTQDRSKLECKIEAQVSEINCLKMEIEKSTETVKIKSKIIEDQTASILKIKEGLNEKDLEAKAFTEKLLEESKQMENQVQSILNENSELKDVISKLTKRKEELKDMIVELQDKLEESEATQKLINQKWKDKSELIAKLENQVVEMKKYWEHKMSELTEERNELRNQSNDFQLKFDTMEQSYKSQLEIAFKNRDFIRQEADERISNIEDEMRKLLFETSEEKKKINSRLRILNKAIQDLGVDYESYK